MTLLGLRALLARYDGPVRFVFSTENSKLQEKLAEIAAEFPKLTLEAQEECSSKLEALRNRLKPSRARRLAARFKEINPSLVVAVQGNIEHSSLALIAALQAGVKSCSYIPVPHSNAEMGAKLGALRDCFCKPLFKLPDSFITITDEMARMLKAGGAVAPIRIVYNGVDIQRFQPGDRTQAREALGLPQDKVLAGVIGRIEFRKKQQHLLVQAVASNPDLVSKCHLVFAGDGPDADHLKEELRKNGVAGTVLSWCDPAPLYRALDVLLVPSRYEGLPLAMLEALASGTPVLASDRDGMRDLLPPDLRFVPNDVSAIGKALSSFVQSGCPRANPALVERVRAEMSLESFADSFSSTLIHLV
ncbi:MAG: glycosyltransferase family 4 protein [Luteolibacter sp.]